ncbi:MAG: hypothetical protein ACXVHV_08955, partial [Methanobacterium sp.]
KYKGTLSQADYFRKYDTLVRNRRVGKLTEEAFQLLMGGQKKSMKTAKSWRHIDNFADNISREIKSGYVKATEEIKLQIEKDILILKDPSNSVRKIEWHIFEGADKEIIDIFEKAKKVLGSDKFDYKIY